MLWGGGGGEWQTQSVDRILSHGVPCYCYSIKALLHYMLQTRRVGRFLRNADRIFINKECPLHCTTLHVTEEENGETHLKCSVLTGLYYRGLPCWHYTILHSDTHFHQSLVID